MSHYAEIELKIQGDAEALIRALCEMDNPFGMKWTKEDILVHETRTALFGYHRDERPQKAHIVIPGSGHPCRQNKVGGLSNDIGFEKRADGKWIAHISENESYAGKYDANWQKRLLSKWAIQSVGLQAERSGKSWSVAYQEEAGKQFAYVRVTGGF